jgi:hypothetical protein
VSRRAKVRARDCSLRSFAPRLCRIGCPDVDRHTVLLAEPLREADMVDVAVREQQRPDIDRGSSHRLQLAKQILPMATQAGIDDRDRARVLDEIAVDQARGAHSMKRGSQLHLVPSVVLRSSGSPPGHGVRGPARSHWRTNEPTACSPRRSPAWRWARPQRQAEPGGQLASSQRSGRRESNSHDQLGRRTERVCDQPTFLAQKESGDRKLP